MTEFWKNYPAQNRDTPVIFYSRCAALIHAEMSKGLDSEACSYYCARQDVAFFDVESITRFARGPGNNYGFKEAGCGVLVVYGRGRGHIVLSLRQTCHPTIWR